MSNTLKTIVSIVAGVKIVTAVRQLSEDHSMLHGCCYLNFEKLIDLSPIDVTENTLLEMTDFGVTEKYLQENNVNNETINVFCIWFESDIVPNRIVRKRFKLISDKILTIHQSSIQTAIDPVTSTIICDDISFHISTTRLLKSYHLCFEDCITPDCKELYIPDTEDIDDIVDEFWPRVESQSDDASAAAVSSSSSNTNNNNGGNHDVHPWVWIVGLSILGICMILFTIAMISYVWTMCKKKKETNNQTNTEEVIGDALEEIAKYTIGDADEDFLFNEDWLYDNSSGSDDHAILGEKILHAVKSTAQLPNLPQSSPKSTNNADNNDVTNNNGTNNVTISDNMNENAGDTPSNDPNIDFNNSHNINLNSVIISNQNDYESGSNTDSNESSDELRCID